MFVGFIEPAPECTVCGLDFQSLDSGDGPAVFVIMSVGFIVVGLALLTELAWRPPIWLHMALWIPLTVALALGVLRPLKAVMLGLHHRNRAEQGRPAD